MSALEAIRSALSGIPYPKVPYWYDGNEKKYITYNYAADHGRDFGDDGPGYNEVSVQVHFFLPIKDNFQQDKNRIRRVLFREGFTWPEVMVLEEDETKTRHIIFECDYTENIEEE